MNENTQKSSEKSASSSTIIITNFNPHHHLQSFRHGVFNPSSSLSNHLDSNINQRKKMANQDQKTRTLEALERRFAASKAEMLHQQQQDQHKSKKRDRGEDGKGAFCFDSSSSTTHTAKASVTLPSNTLKKGNFTFVGYNNSQDAEANDPAYSKLLHSVHESLIKADNTISVKSMLENVLHGLFQSGDSAQKYMQGSRSTRIDNWILLDNFQGRGTSSGTPSRALQSHSRRSKHHMSTKMHKQCGLFKLPSELQKFDNFKPMHEIWKDYIKQLVKSVGNNVAQCLLSADLHGAKILVADCRNSAYTGVSGIMIRETAETFGIITEENKFQVVPKKLSVFIILADCWKVTLHGDKLASRSLSV